MKQEERRRGEKDKKHEEKRGTEVRNWSITKRGKIRRTRENVEAIIQSVDKTSGMQYKNVWKCLVQFA